MKQETAGSSQNYFWIAVLYVAQGFPFGFINEAMPIAFRQAGVDLKKIGLLSLVGLPWTLKFLWSPAVDFLGRPKHWMLCCQCLLAASFFVLATHASGSGSASVWALLVGMAVLSATQDIAIDGYSIRLLNARELGTANGIRVGAYRIALILAGGVLVGASGEWGWPVVQGLAAGLMLALAGVTYFAPRTQRVWRATGGQSSVTSSQSPVTSSQSPVTGSQSPVNSGQASSAGEAKRSPIWEPVKLFFNRRGVIAVFIFIVIFKLGDYAMGPMTKPFLVDRGLSSVEIGLLLGTVGVAATILGAFLGGVLTSRWGIFHALWILGLFQAVSNLGYAGAAFAGGHTGLWAAAIFEMFCGGLGTAAFLAFLMSICHKQFAATQYAVLSALFGLGRSLAGAASGYGASRFGYGSYFALTFLLALPAFALLPWVRKWTPDGKAK
ncbi:MAG: MFS transporter [Planctomycetota bacterium]|nr:MFS transporter [Planctomycetota bacterium]